MSMDWFKCSNRVYQDGRIQRVSWDARGVFWHLLQLISQRGGGPIEAGGGTGYTPAELARMILWADLDASERMETALGLLVGQQLVTRDSVGILRIPRYAEWQRRKPSDEPEAVAERQRRSRAHRREDGHTTSRVTPRDRAEKSAHVTPVTRVEERRREEKREETDKTKTRQQRVAATHVSDTNAAERIAHVYAQADDLGPTWRRLLQDYVAVYAGQNKTGQVAPAREAGLLEELWEIVAAGAFTYGGVRYEGVTAGIAEAGVREMVKQRAASLNYAKQVWRTQLARAITTAPPPVRDYRAGVPKEMPA